MERHTPILSLEGGQKTAAMGVWEVREHSTYLSSYWAVRKGFCPYGILTSMCLVIIRLERDEEVAEPERPCEWHDLPN